MGLLEFNKLPINTLVGADWKTFKAITAGRDIDAAYKGKYRLTKAVCRLLSPLAALQDRQNALGKTDNEAEEEVFRMKQKVQQLVGQKIALEKKLTEKKVTLC